MRNRQELVRELARVLAEPAIAQGVLEDIDYPRGRVPNWNAFQNAEQYWNAVVTQIENGVLPNGGPERLAAAARNQYPGNPVFREAAATVPEPLPDTVVRVLDEDATDASGERPGDGATRWPTLVFRGSNQYEGFVRIARQYAGPQAHLLYAAAEEAAVLLPGHRRDDPDHDALMSAIRRAVDALPDGGDVQVAFREYDFRPQALERLRLIGPDQQVFIAENVPNTAPVRDISYAVLDMYGEPLRQDRFGRTRRTVVDRVVPAATSGGPAHEERLDPDQTLAEAGVQTDDELLIKPESTAGGGLRDRPPPGEGARPPLPWDGPSGQRPQLFLCHSSDDKPQVRVLYERLRGDGLHPWLDEEEILPGAQWERAIRKAVRESDLFVVCLTRGSISKAGYVQREIKDALDIAEEKLDDDIFIVPLRLEPCEVPDRLRKYQWADLYAEGGYARLLRTVESVAAARFRLGRPDDDAR